MPIARIGVYCLAGLDQPVDDDLVGGALAGTSFTTRQLMRNDTSPSSAPAPTLAGVLPWCAAPG